MNSVKLDKIKRPAGIYSFEVQQVASDDFGEWLYAPEGAAWDAPLDAGTLPFDIVLLVQPGKWVIGTWNDEPANPHVGVDICLPPERTDDGWSFVDLELDPFRDASGAVGIVDSEEFEGARMKGYITAAEAEIALATASAMRDALRAYEEPWGDAGWQRLAAFSN